MSGGQIRVLNYNVSSKAIRGSRYGKVVAEQDRILTSFGRYANLPGSRNHKPTGPRDAIIGYLLSVYLRYDIINLVEANQDLINGIKNQIQATHYILRFWHKDIPESLYMVIKRTLKAHDAFCLAMRGGESHLRPVGIVVFNHFAFVGVHLPHPVHENDAERRKLLTNLHQSLQEIFTGLDQTAVIISGDFNTELPMPEPDSIPGPPPFYNNGPIHPKTCFTLVEKKYYDEGERPMQFCYDRFIWSRSVNLIYPPVIPLEGEIQLHLRGEFSDHLPVEAAFTVPEPQGDEWLQTRFELLLFDDRREYLAVPDAGCRTVTTGPAPAGTGVYTTHIYPFNVAYPCLDSNEYRSFFRQLDTGDCLSYFTEDEAAPAGAASAGEAPPGPGAASSDDS